MSAPIAVLPSDLPAPLSYSAQRLADAAGLTPEELLGLRESFVRERSGGRQLRLFVPGKPAPQGSKSYMGLRRDGSAILKESCDEVGPWRERIALAASRAMLDEGLPLIPKSEAIIVSILFVMPRPASAPKTKTPPAVKRPDTDKLLRSVLDGLTDVVWVDDSQVVDSHARKVIAAPSQPPGAHIRIRTDWDAWAEPVVAEGEGAA